MLFRSLLLGLILNKDAIEGFASSSATKLIIPQKQKTAIFLSQRNLNNDDNKKKGYQFGDITKSLIGSRVEKLTGKPYEFGDLSRSIDASIKDSINSLTGKDDYQFGDLSKWVDSQVKKEVNKFTKQQRYQFGDLTREVVRRVATGEYTLDDLFMLLKALAIFEASISPVGTCRVKIALLGNNISIYICLQCSYLTQKRVFFQ
jgi:hypothetical protein